MPEPRAPRDPYKVLQVDSEADIDVIQAAYRRLAQKHHPDVAAEPESAARMAELNAAWERLRDPRRRAEVDRERADRERVERERRAQDDVRRRAPTPPAASSAPPDARPSGAPRPATAPGGQGRRPEEVSPDWTSGRSSAGGGYDPASMRRPEGLGAAGPPPGDPSGSVLNFGRYAGWSLGEVARRDPDFLEWLDRMPIGRPYRDEIDGLLRRLGRRRAGPVAEAERRGLFRRR
ncbi:MAG TPA: DnaJ domain-containing protein [Candidatus Limnocylindrales bacterium]